MEDATNPLPKISFLDCGPEGTCAENADLTLNLGAAPDALTFSQIPPSAADPPVEVAGTDGTKNYGMLKYVKVLPLRGRKYKVRS